KRLHAPRYFLLAIRASKETLLDQGVVILVRPVSIALGRESLEPREEHRLMLMRYPSQRLTQYLRNVWNRVFSIGHRSISASVEGQPGTSPGAQASLAARCFNNLKQQAGMAALPGNS